MKYLPVFLFALLCAHFASAQDCKFDYEKKDAFSGKMTRGITAPIKQSWQLGFNRKGDDYSLGLYVEFNGVREDVIHVGDTLMFAIEDEVPVTLFSSADVKPATSVLGSQITTWYQCQYKISREDITRMSQSKLLAVRVYFGTLFAELYIPGKNLAKIQKAATCIMQ